MTVKPKYGANPTFSRFALDSFRLQLLVMGRAAHDCALPSRLAQRARKGGSGRGIHRGGLPSVLAGRSQQSCGDLFAP
jgi:hypothetical protein